MKQLLAIIEIHGSLRFCAPSERSVSLKLHTLSSNKDSLLVLRSRGLRGTWPSLFTNPPIRISEGNGETIRRSECQFLIKRINLLFAHPDATDDNQRKACVHQSENGAPQPRSIRRGCVERNRVTFEDDRECSRGGKSGTLALRENDDRYVARYSLDVDQADGLRMSRSCASFLGVPKGPPIGDTL
jgi:hypothetical protein